MDSFIGKGVGRNDCFNNTEQHQSKQNVAKRQNKPRRDISNYMERGACFQDLAKMYRLRGRWNEAVTAARDAVNHSPNDDAHRNLLIGLLLEQGNADEAIIEANLWLKRDCSSIGAFEALAKAYWQKADLKASARTMSRLLDINPRDLQYRYQRAVLYEYLGFWVGALQDLLQIQRMAHDEQTGILAAHALKQLDKLQIRNITKLIFENPDFRVEFKTDFEQAIIARGYALSEDGWNVVRWLQLDWSNGDLSFEQPCNIFD